MKCWTTWQINWKVIFKGITWLFLNFVSLNNIIFIICLYESCSKSKWESSGRNASKFQFRWCQKKHWDVYVLSKWSSLFCKFFKYLTLFHCHFVTHNREQRVNRGSMWPTGQISNNSMIHIRWWRCLLPSGPILALPHPNNWLETHSVLLLAKIIEYTAFQLSLSHWFVFIETSRQYLKNLGGLMKRSDSQPR